MKKRYFRSICLTIIYLITFLNCDNTTDDIKLKELYYPTATKYATILRAFNATNKNGKVLPLVAHSRITGDAELQWEVNIEQEDNYDLILNYSAVKNGASITINSDVNSVSNELLKTKGSFTRFPYWPLNMERKLVGQIPLKQGTNKINVVLDTPSNDFETNVYTLELIPVSKKAAIAEDLKKIEAMRPNMDWFTNMRYGAMFHWTSDVMPLEGEPKDYKDAVNDFDVDAFVTLIESMGVDYIIFTGCHAQPHFPAPLDKWEKEYPGMTTKRDLISEISEALHKKNIKFFLYLSTHIYAKFDKVDLDEFERLNFDLVAEIGDYYKEKIDGYWFDGWYQCHEKFPEFDYEKFYDICKIGNPNRLMCLNTWLYTITTPWQDYWAGELYTEGVPQNNPICQSGPAKGLQFHHLIVMQEKEGWVHTKKNTRIESPGFSSEDMINYISPCKGIGPVTINILLYQDGTVGDEALQLMRDINNAILR